jgi:pyrroline-5-carboxylate reductase
VPVRRNASTLLVGAGRMGSTLLKGWIAGGLSPLIAVEPNPSASLKKFTHANRVALLGSIDDVGATRIGACVVAMKPQVLRMEAARLKPIAASGALMLSIAAGTRIDSLRRAWGRGARIVRAMPNTPGAIGKGISALYAPRGIAATERGRAEELLAGLGETVWVNSEHAIDIVTAVSGSGPAYVFLLVECLADAAEAEGLPRDTAERLARATITGAGALLEADVRPPSDLRRDVTSPGGTTEAALSVLTKAMPALVARAVAAACERADALSGVPVVKKDFTTKTQRTRRKS